MRVFISTGEISGDIQGVLLAKKLQELDSSVELVGFCGEKMQQAGVKNIYDMSIISSVGIIESLDFISVFKKLSALKKLDSYASQNKIDVMLLIDNQGINLFLTKYCKKKNIDCIYYFPPHVGIWGSYNAKKLRSCKSVITQFMFDYDVYKNYGCNAIFSGHPFVDIYPKTISNKKYSSKKYTIGVLFGSRTQEINMLGDIFIKAMSIIDNEFEGDVHFLVPIAHTDYKKIIEDKIKANRSLLGGVSYSLLENEHTDDVYTHSDAIMLSSGSASLIAALHEKPMVICYKLSYFTYFIAKFFIKDGFIGMPNILLGKYVVPELLQYRCGNKSVASQIILYLKDKELYSSVKYELSKVRDCLGDRGVVERVAKEVFSSLNNSSTI